jgi:uncharacterized protein (TIGR02099 family)
MVSPSPPGLDAALPPRWRWLRRLAGVAMGLVLLLWTVFLIAWLALHWVILPHIDEWRPTIERHASDAIGLKLSIGEIRVQSSGWVPALELRDLRLFDRAGREALSLAHVHTALAPQSLLAMRFRFDQVLIEGARLEVRRDAAGRWFVAGLDWEGSPGAEQDTRARDWFFQQHEFIVRNGVLRWVDEQSGAPPLELTELDLVLRNGLRRHALRLDATPPTAWGRRFSLRGRFDQPLLAPAGELRRWSGTLYADLPLADVAELRRHLSLPFELGEGDGALRAWVEIAQGAPRKVTLDFALRAVSLQLTPALERLDFAQVRGRLDAERDADGVTLRARDLAFLTGDGLNWPSGGLHVAWRQKQDLRDPRPSAAPVTGGEISADRLDLDVLARTAARLPLGDAWRAALAEIAPRGLVESLKASWGGPPQAPDRYQVNARLSGVTLQSAALAPGQPSASTRRPGVRNAQVQFTANERGGEARVSITPGALVLPGVWEQPEMALDEFDAALAWRVTPAASQAPMVEVRLKHARFANADMQGEFDATWTTGAGQGVARGGRFPGRVDFTGKLQRGRAESVARYLPLGIASAARDYVRRSIQGGHIASANFKVNGDLWDFPFHSSRDGEFRITAQVQDLRYAFLPSRPGGADGPAWDSPWPGFDRVSGELEFDRLAMNFRGAQGRLWGYELREVEGGIQDLSAARPVLALQGLGRGPAADLLRFVRLAPPGQHVGPAFEAISVNGPSELKLAISMPLAQPAQTSVRGSLQLPGNDLRLHPELPPLLGARGTIDFTSQGLVLRAASARVFGGEASFEGSAGVDGTLRFAGQGVATAEALRATAQPAALARVASSMRGQATWRASFGLLEGRSEIMLSSDLVGMQIDLPAPLAKAAGVAWPMRLQVTPVAAAAAGADPRDNLLFELGDVLKARYQRDVSGIEPLVIRGSLAVLDTLPAPTDPGVRANLNLGRLDVDAWKAVVDRLGVADDAGASGYLPQALDLRADELRAGPRYLSNVAAAVQSQGPRGDTSWLADVKADQLAGRLEYRPPAGPAQAGRVKARLERLSLPQSDVATVEDLLAQPPASVPALDIVVEDFELRGRKLGRLEVTAVNRLLPGRAGQREWQLDRLNVDSPEAQLNASGRWSAGGARRMALDFTLRLADSGALIERLGAGHALRGGKGQLQGQLSWAGSPLALDYPSLDGKLRLDVDAGQFMHAEPGGARLLGVLSLQALPRRLLLDFRDVFQEGFAFDSVAGDVSVAHGVADTRNLVMRGVQATVLMQGSADLLRETQDLRVLIVPNFDASGAALATMAINPAIGLGALFAQWVLREPLIAAGTREFHVTGPWAEPNVQPIERSAGSPLPSIDAPTPQRAPSSGTAAPPDKRLPG